MELDGNVVMRDIDELGDSASLSKDDLQRAAIGHGVDALQIEPGKAEECSIGSTDDAGAESLGSQSKDVSVSSKSSEAELGKDSVGSSNEAILGMEEADMEPAEREGIAGLDQEEVRSSGSAHEEVLSEFAESRRSLQPRYEVVNTSPASAKSGQEGILAEHANAPSPPQPHQGVQDAMPDSDEVKELQRPMRGCDSFRSEADEMPCTGFVSQRVSAFTKLASNRSQSFSNQNDAPDRGLVSERIRAHQRFISSAAPGEQRALQAARR
jgi:hypothetical protein